MVAPNSHDELFNAAWQKVLAGQSIESVLEEYPGVDELEPMLRVALSVRGLPGPEISPDGVERIRRRTLSAAANRAGAAEQAGGKRGRLLSVVPPSVAGPRATPGEFAHST